VDYKPKHGKQTLTTTIKTTTTHSDVEIVTLMLGLITPI